MSYKYAFVHIIFKILNLNILYLKQSHDIKPTFLFPFAFVN